MRAYHKEILENSIAYIAEEFFAGTGTYIPQLIMFKILALFDFCMLKKNGIPSTDLKYYAYPRGPLPLELYENNWHDTEKTIRIEDDGTRFKPVGTADLDYLSDEEVETLKSFVERAVSEKWDKDAATKVSHDEIKAWKIAFEKKKNSLIDYADEFDSFKSKKESEMTLQERKFLHYSFVENINGF